MRIRKSAHFEELFPLFDGVPKRVQTPKQSGQDSGGGIHLGNRAENPR